MGSDADREATIAALTQQVAEMPMPTIPKLPDLSQMIADEKNVAKRMCQVLAEDIAAFERALDPTEEVGARVIGAPDGSVFHIEGMTWRSREVICFTGQSPEGRPVRLMQHVSQVSIMLVALPTTSEGRRIGFVLLKQHAER